MSASDGLIIECFSSQSDEGVITGRDGNTIPFGETTSVWRLSNPFNRPGVLRLQTHNAQSLITAAERGIYTCTVPDGNGGQIVINVGLYPSGFIGELCSYSMCVQCEK